MLDTHTVTGASLRGRGGALRPRREDLLTTQVRTARLPCGRWRSRSVSASSVHVASALSGVCPVAAGAWFSTTGDLATAMPPHDQRSPASPWHHRDPPVRRRLLIAQASVENLPIVSVRRARSTTTPLPASGSAAVAAATCPWTRRWRCYMPHTADRRQSYLHGRRRTAEDRVLLPGVRSGERSNTIRWPASAARRST